jgi:DNA primase large subunit
MAKYPFLQQARQHIASFDLDYKALVELPRIRERAKQRVYSSFALSSRFSLEPSRDFETEVMSYPLAILLAAGTGDYKLIERFALLEAQQINRNLREEKREEIILEIAKAFRWVIHYSDTTPRMKAIHFAKFLKATSDGRLFQTPKWKLVNRALDKGWVYTTPYELARLLQEEVKEKIEDSATQELASIPPEIQNDIDELKATYAKLRPHLEEFDQIVRAQESEYPPCISSLIKRAAKGVHMSHVERFTLVTYLLNQGVSIDSIVSLFSSISDFKEDKTRYQVENLAGKTGGRTKPYLTYNCSSLQTHHVCSGSTDPICRTIRNPLTYHLRKQRQNRAFE